MKPIIIFRHAANEGPGYLATVLSEQGLSWQLVKIDEGELLPISIADYSGMVLMGGPMSVNDDLPWIPPLLALIKEAIALDIPLLGHCLGGQLISKALGGEVTKNLVKEFGWGEVKVSNNASAKHWFGDIESFNAFHWHGETFNLPIGAIHLLKSEHCYHQAFAIGKHLAFQCHIEMTPEMVSHWCDIGADTLKLAVNSASEGSLAVQQADEMQQNLLLHCFFLNKVAKQVYLQWIKGLAS